MERHTEDDPETHTKSDLSSGHSAKLAVSVSLRLHVTLAVQLASVHHIACVVSSLSDIGAIVSIFSMIQKKILFCRHPSLQRVADLVSDLLKLHPESLQSELVVLFTTLTAGIRVVVPHSAVFCMNISPL